jgi:predicted O-linked N-acetylglucosamine transferase (SPINDLY family)
MIKNDSIDILVDLAGHSGDNKLSIFLYKPAPIQVTYLGYPNTTGLSTMDYRITDAWTDPEGEDRYYTEKLYRLPGGFLCYNPPENIPEIETSPVLKNGYITFGSFNNLAKICFDTVKVWSEILKNVPGSKLKLKSKAFNDKNVIDYFCKMFASQGIDTDRIMLKGHSLSTEEHLHEYNSIDIALDTFPYNGTTTTCEALLMGTPVINLLGKRHAGRVGCSILTKVGLKEWIADDIEDYISTACRFSKDNQYILQSSQILQMNFKSLLCNGKVFTKSLENAYLNMWKMYCSK